MSDDEPKKIKRMELDEPNFEPTMKGLGDRERTMVGVGETGPESAPAPAPAAPERTVLGAREERDPAPPVEKPEVEKPKAAALVAAKSVRAVEPPAELRKGGGAKWFALLVLGGLGVAAYVQRDRIAAELSPPPAPSSTAVPSAITSATSAPVAEAAAPVPALAASSTEDAAATAGATDAGAVKTAPSAKGPHATAPGTAAVKPPAPKPAPKPAAAAPAQTTTPPAED